jgi:apolipoprotein N-acyltransferase
LPYVEVFGLAFLAYSVFRAPTIRQGAAAGFLFGLGNFAVGFYWLYISLHVYGGLSLVLAIGAVIILAAFEALFVTLACASARALSARHLHRLTNYRWHLLIVAVWASCWTGAEWLRGTLFTGFPWLNIGYAHVEGVFSGWAPVIGVYGIAWLASFAAGAIGLLACANNTRNDAPAAITVGVAIVTGLLGIVLGHIGWSSPSGDPLVIRLVQGNIPQSEKFDPQRMLQGIDTYMHLAALPAKGSDKGPDIIVLPETIMPLFQDRYSPQLWQRWLDIAKERQATIIMGIPLHRVANGIERYTNSAIAFSANTPIPELLAANMPLRYDKHHLVPFGEFIPTGFRWFVDLLNIPLGDFNRGPVRQRLFDIHGQVIAMDICYEDLFGEEIIQSVNPDDQHGAGASILVNISNLAWFGDSWALRQHLQISRMRALETARPMIRATNTGTTAAIDPNGTVRAALPVLKRGVLDVEVQGTSGLTPYVRWGNPPILVWTGLLLLLGFFLRKKQH